MIVGMQTVRITVRLMKPTRTRLKIIAAERDVSVQELMEQAAERIVARAETAGARSK